jgi:high-affinity iron transporter
MNFSAALPTFVITLREGFEAALVVGIVLACLQKAGQTQLNSWVYRGISAGIIGSVMIGLLLGGVLQGVNHSPSPYTPLVKEILAALFGSIAVILLSWMLLWMTRQAKSLKSEVEGAIQTALNQDKAGGKAVFLLVFIAVLREGFETVLFILAQFDQGWPATTLGAIAGLTSAAILGILLFKGGVKLNIRLFFQMMGIFLLLIVGGLLIGVLKHLDQAMALLSQMTGQNWCLFQGASCLLGSQIWDGSSILPDRQFPGILLKSLFGYRQTLYLGQAIAYLLFLLTIGSLYFQSLQTPLDNPQKTAITTTK